MPKFINRPPRIQPELPEGEREIPSPPERKEDNLQAIFQLGLPLITILGYILISATGQGRSLIMIIPMGLSVVVSTALALYLFVQKRRDRKIEDTEYSSILHGIRHDMIAAHEMQRLFYTYNYPEPQNSAAIPSGEMDSRSGSRLWERRSSDQDFGEIRLGMGVRPSRVVYKAKEARDIHHHLAQEAQKIADDSCFIQEIPVTIPLRGQPMSEEAEQGPLARHSMGIVGQETSVSGFVRALLVNFTAFHAPTESRVYVVGTESAQSRWAWARWLPHCNARSGSSTGDQLAFDIAQVRRRWDDLQQDLERRQKRLTDNPEMAVDIPMLLVIIDALTDGDDLLENAASEACISLIMEHGPRLGAAILFMVPERQLVPSNCISVLEIDQAVFRYAEVGLNSLRLVGTADTLETTEAENFARKLAPVAVQTGYGGDIALTVDLLELNQLSRVEDLPIESNWEASRQAANAEWLRAPIGLMVGNKVRELVFSADGDGVHGMIAGTTGSGKSELLLTLITGLAVRYDPSIVNFVLVDYKGGSAFDPFRDLPHCVDIVTNLQGSATARTFAALRAELNRRSKLIADTNVKHIVHYRQKNLHLTHEPFPNLFVVIDEFAEMVKEQPETRAQLDSITRLGRALGVSLILATQRPAGAVSDQMRANMKFRICLRVETPEDSRELLRRSDAAFLPPNVPGRAYLQVGNENVELIQVARAGGPYTEQQTEIEAPIIWLNRQQAPLSMMMKLAPQTEAPALSDVIVELTARKAIEDSDVQPQRKPWPDPLPEYLPLDAPYLPDSREPNPLLPLNPAVREWLNDKEKSWAGVDWQEDALTAAMGLMDNPLRAEQLLLKLDLTGGHIALFGAPGAGKTVFVRSLITSLAVTHSPDELHIYALDFGGRGLDVLLGLPHFGASINSSEEERVQRLLRRLGGLIEDRRTLFSEAQVDSLMAYNATHPASILPAVLVVIDNFAQFNENFEPLMMTLIQLVRDSRAYGVHFVITADQMGVVPAKLLSLFTERLTLKLADNSEYAGIVGRGAPIVDDIAGRGLIAIDRNPLLFQTALPLGVSEQESAVGLDESKKLAALVEILNDAWGGAYPEPIEVLRPVIALRTILPDIGHGQTPIQTLVGLEDLDLRPAVLDLQMRGPHFLILGPPLSGKTTTLRTWALSLAHSYRPDQVAMVLVDFQQRMYEYGGQYSLGDLPHVIETISEVEQISQLPQRLTDEYESGPRPTRELFILIDNYDDLVNAVGPSTRSTFYKDLALLARKYGPSNLHMVLCGSLGIMRTLDDLLKQVMAPRYGLGLDAAESAIALGGRTRGGGANANIEFPPGRGYVVKSGRLSLIQVATPSTDNALQLTLDDWIAELIAQYPQKATWTAELPMEAK